MGGDLVEQHHRRLPASARQAAHGRARSRAAAPSARRSRRWRPAMPFAPWHDGKIGEVRSLERAAGSAVAPARPRAAPRDTVPRRPSAASSSTAFSTAPSRASRAKGKTTRVGLPPISAARRRTVSAREAATAMAISAISCSAASSQRPSVPVCSSSRLRLRKARSSALTRAPWPASTASTSRSRKRRRSPAGPANRPSIAGVSQTTADARRRRRRTRPATARSGSGAAPRRPALRRRCRDAPGRPRRRPRPPRRRRRRALLAGDFVEIGATQALAGRQQRQRLEHIGLAGAIRAGEHDQAPRIDRQVEAAIGARMTRQQRRRVDAGFDRHTRIGIST